MDSNAFLFRFLLIGLGGSKKKAWLTLWRLEGVSKTTCSTDWRAERRDKKKSGNLLRRPCPWRTAVVVVVIIVEKEYIRDVEKSASETYTLAVQVPNNWWALKDLILYVCRESFENIEDWEIKIVLFFVKIIEPNILFYLTTYYNLP